ncbi:hypothetical protein [Nevskia soli]|jgi:membrane protein implicated in regulation of membrane protease activity|uniref:hypothetical protein n=1 Tax=Nevskia soli TaxID=418856 RepID=UPI0015D8F17E|nr:hypothetical protein [Nevskia soli]
MASPDVFVLCLAVGFVLSVLSLLAGGLHLPHLHLHLHLNSGHLAKGVGGPRGGSMFNLFTIAAFLMWFGGSGYLLDRLTPWVFLVVVAVAVPLGLIGAAIVYWFMSHVLLANDRPLDPLDYDMTGSFGKIVSPLRPGGTGEMICAQQGRRIGVPVRSETGAPIDSGTEVVVTRYESGIAYVRGWDEFESLSSEQKEGSSSEQKEEQL